VEEKQRRFADYAELLESIQIRAGEESDALLESLGTAPLEESVSAARLLRRPQISFEDLLLMLSEGDRERLAAAPADVVEQLAVQARYEGYIRRQLAEIRRHRATETLPVPEGFDYWPLEGLTYEAKDKLSRLRPATLGQASRVPGVSPADISVLLVHLYRSLRSRSSEGGDDERTSARSEGR
jgi:tRNA uridine 5-carboxymethylaminomethyl modification enzyme